MKAFPPRRIVLLKPCCIGDVLMATPLARSVKAAWPEARIDWAVGSHSRPVLVGNPDIHALVDATGTQRGDLRLAAVARLVRTLRSGGYDAAFIAERSPIPALIARLAGIPMRVGLDSGGRGRWHTVRVPATVDDPRHETAIYLDLARAVGIPPAEPRPVFVPSAGDVAAAEAAIAAMTASATSMATPDGGPTSALPRPWLVLHPGGGRNPGAEHLAKRWPAAGFAAIASRWTGLGGTAIVVGGPDDVAPAAEVVSGAAAYGTCAFDVAGRLSLGATAALIARADAYLGSDSGVAHLAAAVGTPVVVVFGPTSALRYGPVPGAGEAVTPGGWGRPIEAVTVEAVWKALQRVFRGAPA